MADDRQRTRSAERLRRRPRSGAGDGAGGSGGGDSGGRPAARSGGSGPTKWLLAAAAAVAVGAGLWFGLGGGGSDQITEAESQQAQAAYAGLIAGGGMALDMVGADDIDRAVESMPVTEEQREAVRQQVAQGRVRLAWVTLWDTHAEDGDILRFESEASLPVEVTALNQPTTLAIPFPPSGVVQVTGVVDGGGGITIGLKSGATSLTWPTMQPGDMLDLPVTPGF